MIRKKRLQQESEEKEGISIGKLQKVEISIGKRLESNPEVEISIGQ